MPVFQLPLLPLDSGKTLRQVDIAYETYGRLDKLNSNGVLICHALTGDQYVAETNPDTGKPGWWHAVVGDGKPIDTRQHFVICSNVLGGCHGTTGPASVNPGTDEPYGLSFPTITINDMVRAQAALLEHLGIEKLSAVVGASMGGMQALQWAAEYPEKVNSVLAIACSYRHTAQNIAFHEVGRQAIMADPAWKDGDYYDKRNKPKRGLAVARMAAHVTYMSEQALAEKFGRNLQTGNALSYSFDADFQVESYLRYQGSSFVQRFDANSYLYITRAVDYFDLAIDKPLAQVFSEGLRYCIISLSTDWLFPTIEHKTIVKALNAKAASVSFVEIETDKGHDGFLHQEQQLWDVVRGFMMGV